MIELLSALVANGTTFGPWGYASWLPFYNFFPIIAVIAVAILWLGLVFHFQGRKVASIFVLGTVWSLFPAYLSWFYGGANPSTVFRTWAGCSLILIGVMLWVSQWIPSAHEFDSVEEYMEHIRTEHPDLWREIEKNVEEKTDDKD